VWTIQRVFEVADFDRVIHSVLLWSAVLSAPFETSKYLVPFTATQWANLSRSGYRNVNRGPGRKALTGAIR